MEGKGWSDGERAGGGYSRWRGATLKLNHSANEGETCSGAAEKTTASSSLFLSPSDGGLLINTPPPPPHPPPGPRGSSFLRRK